VKLSGVLATKGAKAAIEAAGGSVVVTEVRIERVITWQLPIRHLRAATVRRPEAPLVVSPGCPRRVPDSGRIIPVPASTRPCSTTCSSRSKAAFSGLFNVFSGGALSRFSIFALGIMPYISASIIMQLCTVVVPTLER
jgi:hypothetical protein